MQVYHRAGPRGGRDYLIRDRQTHKQRWSRTVRIISKISLWGCRAATGVMDLYPTHSSIEQGDLIDMWASFGLKMLTTTQPIEKVQYRLPLVGGWAVLLTDTWLLWRGDCALLCVSGVISSAERLTVAVLTALCRHYTQWLAIAAVFGLIVEFMMAEDGKVPRQYWQHLLSNDCGRRMEILNGLI